MVYTLLSISKWVLSLPNYELVYIRVMFAPALLHLKSKMSKVSAFYKNYRSEICSVRQNSFVYGAIKFFFSPSELSIYDFIPLYHYSTWLSSSILKTKTRSVPVIVTSITFFSFGFMLTYVLYKSKFMHPASSFHFLSEPSL